MSCKGNSAGAQLSPSRLGLKLDLSNARFYAPYIYCMRRTYVKSGNICVRFLHDEQSGGLQSAWRLCCALSDQMRKLLLKEEGFVPQAAAALTVTGFNSGGSVERVVAAYRSSLVTSEAKSKRTFGRAP